MGKQGSAVPAEDRRREGRPRRTPSPRRRVTAGLPTTWGPKPGDPGRNIAAAVGTGLTLAGLFVICYVIGPAALVGLATVAIAGCALEAFAMFQRAGFRPATLVGALG